MTMDADGTMVDADTGDLTEASAAVLGVESGPITISYRDTDGKKQTLRIEIDTQPPAINVAAPAHGSSSGDQSPISREQSKTPILALSTSRSGSLLTTRLMVKARTRTSC